MPRKVEFGLLQKPLHAPALTMGELESDTMHITRGVDENCAKVDAPSERKMRGLLLRYMLYDALVRPSEWQFAPAFDAARVSAWETALRALFQRLADDSSGQLPIHMASLEAPRQISIVPLLAARAAASSSATIAAYEPIRPTAAALRSAASDNGKSPRRSGARQSLAGPLRMRCGVALHSLIRSAGPTPLPVLVLRS